MTSIQLLAGRMAALVAVLASIGICKPISESVEFSVPLSWHKMDNMTRLSDTLCVYSFYLGTDTISGAPCHANALIQFFDLPDSLDMGIADDVVSSHVPTATYVISAADGQLWKSYLLAASQEGVQYLILLRIGIDRGVCAEFMLSFPHRISQTKPQDSLLLLTLSPEVVIGDEIAGVFCDTTELRQYVEEFNYVCEKLKIRTANEFKAKAVFLSPPNEAVYHRDTTLKR